jgi:membrane-associated phospholipid phosphatase
VAVVHPQEHAPGRLATAWARLERPRNGVRELLLVAALYIGYTASRKLADADMAPAKARAHALLRIEQAVHLDAERWLDTWFVHHGTIALLGCYYYSTAHYIATPAALVFLYFKGRDQYLPARRALVVGTLIALALYIMLPTAPPRFMGFRDLLALHQDQGWWSGAASAPKGMAHLTNQLAAFPSLHAGWSMWVALYITRATRNVPLRALAWLHALVTALVVIGTGNHWVLDVLVGWLVVIAGAVSVAAFSTAPRHAVAPAGRNHPTPTTPGAAPGKERA